MDMDITDRSKQRVRVKDEDLEELIRTYRPQFYGLALALLGDVADADDATQDALLALLDALPTFAGQSQFRTWAFSIAIHVCQKRLRRRYATARMLRGLQSLLRLRADEPQVEKSVARNETDRLLIEQVTALDEKFRIPIVLFYGQQMSAEEIGEVLGIPRGTVLSRLHAARECLRGGLVRKGVNWHERD